MMGKLSTQRNPIMFKRCLLYTQDLTVLFFSQVEKPISVCVDELNKDFL